MAKLSIIIIVFTLTCILLSSVKGLTNSDGKEIFLPGMLRIPRPRLIENWPTANLPHLGQISGIAVNLKGQPVIVYRGPRVFNSRSFDDNNDFQIINEGPIDVDTVLTLHPVTGAILKNWGTGLFYLPHGITIDNEGNTWITDIAMHQVFKFSPGNLTTPSMTIGRTFKHEKLEDLCMPTSVAVARFAGEVFIADGYCNSRIMKYNHHGILIRIYPTSPEFLNLQIPHSLTLMEKYDVLCIADRENMRVVCIKVDLFAPKIDYNIKGLNIQQPDLGRVFGIASYGELIYAINGDTSPSIPIQGFTIHPSTESIVDHWNLSTTCNSQKIYMPHDIAISADGTDLYVASISPNRIMKFSLKDSESSGAPASC